MSDLTTIEINGVEEAYTTMRGYADYFTLKFFHKCKK